MYGSSQQESQKFHPLHHLLWTGEWEALVRGQCQKPAWGVLRANNKTEFWVNHCGWKRTCSLSVPPSATLVKGPNRETTSGTRAWTGKCKSQNAFFYKIHRVLQTAFAWFLYTKLNETGLYRNINIYNFSLHYRSFIFSIVSVQLYAVLGSSLLNHLMPALFITARDLVTPTLYSQSLTGCWKPEGFKMWSVTTYSREAISTNSVQMDLLQTGTGPTPTNFTESLNTSLMHTSIWIWNDFLCAIQTIN